MDETNRIIIKDLIRNKIVSLTINKNENYIGINGYGFVRISNTCEIFLSLLEDDNYIVRFKVAWILLRIYFHERYQDDLLIKHVEKIIALYEKEQDDYTKFFLSQILHLLFAHRQLDQKSDILLELNMDKIEQESRSHPFKYFPNVELKTKEMNYRTKKEIPVNRYVLIISDIRFEDEFLKGIYEKDKQIIYVVIDAYSRIGSKKAIKNIKEIYEEEQDENRRTGLLMALARIEGKNSQWYKMLEKIFKHTRMNKSQQNLYDRLLEEIDYTEAAKTVTQVVREVSSANFSKLTKEIKIIKKNIQSTTEVIKELLIIAQEDESSSFRALNAINCLGYFGEYAVEAIPLLINVLTKPTSIVYFEFRGAAASSLGKIAQREDIVIPALSSVLDSEAYICRRAADALINFGEKAESVIQRILELLDKDIILIERDENGHIDDEYKMDPTNTYLRILNSLGEKAKIAIPNIRSLLRKYQNSLDEFWIAYILAKLENTLEGEGMETLYRLEGNNKLNNIEKDMLIKLKGKIRGALEIMPKMRIDPQNLISLKENELNAFISGMTKIGIITAIEEEAEAVNHYFKTRLVNDNQDNPCWLGVLYQKEENDGFGVIHYAGQKGIAITSYVQKLIEVWNPKLIFVVGIAGGLDRNKVSLGDIVIPGFVINISRKSLENGKEVPQPETLRIKPKIFNSIRDFSRSSKKNLWYTIDKDGDERIQLNNEQLQILDDYFNGKNRPEHIPEIHCDNDHRMLCGKKFEGGKENIDRILDDNVAKGNWRYCKSIETEGSDIMETVKLDDYLVAIIKAISDLPDHEHYQKSKKKFHHLAAFRAAKFLYYYLKEGPIKPTEKQKEKKSTVSVPLRTVRSRFEPKYDFPIKRD